MALIVDALIEILNRPTVADVIHELAAFAAPICVAVLVGMVAGWAWRPRWAVGLVEGPKAASFTPPLPEPERAVELRSSIGLCLTETLDEMVAGGTLGAELAIQVLLPFAKSMTDALENQVKSKVSIKAHLHTYSNAVDASAVTVEDFEHLHQLVQVRDGGPEWQQMMEKSMPSFGYRAWKREPENGPPKYRSSTVFDSAALEVVRDFFWDDEFRAKNRWDDMLLEHATLEECEKTGTMVVRWVRKFPFFCSDREYIIGRRIWEVDGTYYCVTKSVPRPSVPRQNKPRRVDLYYSSWCIRPVESRSGDGEMTACEVLLFHHEDMGIPWEIAKLGVRQGMWGCVKKIEPGLRAYQIARSRNEPRSRCAIMAGINTKVHPNFLVSMEETGASSSKEIVADEKLKPNCGNIPKLLLVGGAVAVACSLDRGLLTKAFIFGVARRFGMLGKRL